MALYVKKRTGDWVQPSSIYVKERSGTWKLISKGFVKKASGWFQFWPKAGPNIDFPLEITSSNTSWPATLTGKNYHWEGASTLSYKFQSSLTNTTNDSAWTDLMSYTTIANPTTGNFNTQTFSITSANFSTTVRSKWFRFVVKGTDSSTGTITTEVSNNINISKSALVGTAGTVVIARSSASSYIYSVTNNGTWSSTPVSYSYQWQQLLSGTWTDISGATSISNNMSSFVQKDIRCKVYAVDDLGATSELPIISNTLFVDYAPPSVTSFTATGGVSKITYSYVVSSDNQFPTITLKIERLQSGGSYLQTNFVNLVSKTGTNVVESVTISGTYRATLTASDGINPDSSIVVNNLTVAALNRSNVAIAQTTTNLSGASNITFSKTGIGSSQTGVIGWTNGSGVTYSDVSWTGNYSGSDLNKTISGSTQSSSFALSAATGSASITATVVQKALPQATISWDQTNAASYRVTYRATSTIAPGGFVDTVLTGNSSASSVSLIVNAASATVRVLEVIVYEYSNQNSGQPTGSTVGNFTITPAVQVTLGATQDFTTSASGTITYTYPTISGISVSNTTPFPGSATSISVSNSPPSNTGSVSWANGSNTSVANLFSVSGSGSGGAGTNPSSLLTSGSFTVVSTGTANATIRAINTSITVHATWTQADAQSYRVLYTTNAIGGIQTLNGNSSSTNPLALIGSSANSFTLQSVTVYPELNQGGSGVTLASTASASGATRTTDTSGSGSVTFTAPTYTVTWNANGGNGGGSTTQSQGSAHIAPSPGTRSGFTFNGYYDTTSLDFTYGPIASGGSFNPPSSMTMYARWSAVVNPPTNASIPTLSPTSISVGTLLTAGVGTWNNSPTSYDIRIYRGTANVSTGETLVASGTSTSLTYTVTQADYTSGQLYFRTYVNASNSGGSSGFVAGQERGPIATPVVAPTNASQPTISGGLAVGSTIFFGVGSWNNSPTSYDLRLYRGTQFVSSGETLISSAGNTTSSSYVITQADFNSGQRYFRTFASASNSAGSSGLVAGAEIGPITSGGGGGAAPVLISLTGNNSLQYGGTFSWSFSNSPTAYSIFVTGPSGTVYTTSNQYTYGLTTFRPGYDGTGWQGGGNYTIYISATNASGSSVTSNLTTFMN